MSWLDDLYARAGAHRGSWLGLPDFGKTEELGRTLGVQENPVTGGTGLSNLIARVPNPGPVQPSQPVRQSTGGFQSVLGTAQNNLNTGSGGNMTRVTAPTTAVSTDLGPSAAELAYRSAIANAQGIRDRGLQTFNDLLASVNDFRTRAGTLKDTGNQEVINQSADTLGSNATTAQQLAGSANAQGRNLGLSSKLNLGQRILGNLQQTQGNTLARKGENLRENENLYQSRLSEADAKQSEAERYRQEIEDAANSVEAGGLSGYVGALDTLVNRANALSAINPLDSSGLTGYTPDMSGIVNTLNGLLGSTPTTTAAPDAGAGNLAISPSLADYFRRSRPLYQR